MKKILLFLTIATCVCSASAQTLTINAEKAVVSFNYIKHETTGYVKGIAAEIVFDVNDLTKSYIQGTAEVKTLSTGNKQRDEHLMEPEYFDVAKFSQMKFKSTSITATEKGYAMTGLLTIKDVEKEVTFNFTFIDNVFEGKATIYANDFGIATEKKAEDSKIILKASIPVL